MNKYSTSPLEITARIDAALADAGLDGPLIEREPLPLFFSLLAETIGSTRVKEDTPQAIIADQLWQWSVKQCLGIMELEEQVNGLVQETLDLAQVHGTLTDIKRHEILTYQAQLLHKLQRLQQGHDLHAQLQAGLQVKR
jgi:hypothetical protein